MKKQYKHKSGKVATKEKWNHYYRIEDELHPVPKWVIEDSSDWEAIVEKEYEIVSKCPIEGTIHSVRRLSDNELFTVGDKVCNSQDPIERIVESTDYEGGIALCWEGRSAGLTNATHNEEPVEEEYTREYVMTVKGAKWQHEELISHLILDRPYVSNIGERAVQQDDESVHAKEPINGEHIVYWVDDYWHIKTFKVKNANGRKYWQTEEDAEEYVLMNKPMFSVWDIKDLDKEYVRATLSSPDYAVISYKILAEKAEQKLNKNG